MENEAENPSNSSENRSTNTENRSNPGENRSNGSEISENRSNEISETNKSNIVMVCFNFINSIIGVAVIGIPYAFKETGFGLGILLLVVFAVMSKYSLEILITSARAVEATSYQELIKSQYGNWGFYYLSAIQFTYPFIFLVIYNVIVADSCLEVFADSLSIPENKIHIYRPLVILVYNVCVSLPMSMLCKIKRISEVSLMSLIFVIMMVAMVTIEVAMQPHIMETESAYRFASGGIIEALGIIAVAFICHHNAFLLYEQLEDPTPDRWSMAASISTFASFGIISLFGIAGYIKFTGYSHSNIFKNFCGNDAIADFAKVAFAVNLIFTYPIQVFVVRDVVQNVFFPQREWTILRHTVITLTIGVVAFAISTVAACVKFTLELTGVFAAFPLAYVIPSALYMKVNKQRGISRENFQIVLMGFVGVIITIGGTIKIILDIVDEKSCKDMFTPTFFISLHSYSMEE